jgi:hypothetical protein
MALNFSPARSRRVRRLGGEVLVAQAGTRSAIQLAQGLHHRPAFVAPAPAGLGIGEVCQGVHDGVEVGRDGQAEMLEVVGSVDRNGERFGR